MKVIAHIDLDGLLVSMTRDELARAVGLPYATEFPAGRYADVPAFRIGAHHELSAIYNRLRSQEQIKDRMSSAASSLRALADLLETLKPIADEVTQ